MITFKNDKLEKLFTCFLVFSFIIMTLPRSIKNVSETIYYGINYFKIALVFIIFLITIIKKVKLSKLTLLFVVYMAYTFLTTIINHQSPVYFFKIYTFNFGILLLCELIMKCNDRKRIFHFISKYLVVILSLNLLDILLYKVFNFGFKSYYNIYLLGIDNRFILYIFATIITYLYLYIEDERLKIDLYIAYIVGLLSVFLVWSVSAACVVALIGFLFLILKKKKIHINPYIVLICILLIAFLIPFFKIHYMFKFIIVDILHKPLDLSYRVDVWNVAIDYIFKHISKVFNGFGYFNLRAAKYLPYALRIGHLHNIIMNLLFYTGIIGLIIYMLNIFEICKSINNHTKTMVKNWFIIIFSGLMILMIFDTFELYPVYYYIIFMLYYSSIYFKTCVKNTAANVEVSVICCTYNQEKYICECLDGLLNQTTSFKYEIIVHDDASTDNTKKILTEYEKKYKQIKVFYEKENQYSKGVDIFEIMIGKCSGKYIALCEGDDYWYDSNKLQFQYTFMEEHPNCSLVTTDTKILNEINNKFTSKKKPYNYSRYFSTDEVIMYDGDLFSTCTMFFVNKIDLPEFYHVSPVGDYPLTIYLSLIGDVYYYNKCTAVYRKNAKGSWTESMKDMGYIESKKKMIKNLSIMFDELNNYTNNKYKKSTDYIILKRNFELDCLNNNKKNIKNKEYRLLYKNGNIKNRFKFFIKIHFNSIFVFIKKYLR